jgi:hypothetical protein
MHTCVNCGQAVSTAFCASCGQQNPPKRLSLLSLYTDFQSRIYGFDGMFPRTLRDLTVRPGHVAMAYINGNRVKYVGPVGYFFLAVTFMLLFMEILSIDLHDLSVSNYPFAPEPSKSQEVLQRRFSDMISKNMRLFSFTLIPVTGLFAWMFFRKQKLNFMEHTILVFYTSGHLTWFSIINLFTFKFFNWNFNAYLLFINIIFFAFACTTFYTSNSKAKSFLKGILVSLLSYGIYILVIATGALVYMLRDPEMLELLRQQK